MTTRLRNYRDALLALVTTDATFTAAVAALLGGVVVNRAFKTNQPLQQLSADMLPCWVFEWGDGAEGSVTNSNYTQTIGLTQQDNISEAFLVLIWNEQDRDVAGNARTDLPELLNQLLLRNPQPGGCQSVTLTGWQPDRAVNHPLQVWRAVVRGEHTFYRDS